jgi:hypothetical protein
MIFGKDRQIRAIIAADVRRFGQVINTDGVFGTHSARESPLPQGPTHHTFGPRTTNTSRPSISITKSCPAT